MFQKSDNSRLYIYLDGPDGNAFNLIATAMCLIKRLYVNHPLHENLDPCLVKEEMMSGDYIHLLNVFEKYFGEYVVMVTDQDSLQKYCNQ